MRIKKQYPLAAALTFVISVTSSYIIRSVGKYLADSISVDDLPRQQLVNESMESRDVYSAVLQQAFVRHRYRSVTIAKISADCSYAETVFDGGKNLTEQQIFEREHTEMSVELATIENYVGKNKYKSELFLEDLGIPNELISEDEIGGLFGEAGGGWEAFYKQYSGSLGLVHFSKVGFNSRYDQAFVYVATACQSTCGYGEYVLLNKENEKWLVKVIHIIWES
jgi:hypothetical protein